MRKPPFRAAWIDFDGGAEGLDTAGSCAGWNRQVAKRAACDSAQVTVLRVPEAPPQDKRKAGLSGGTQMNQRAEGLDTAGGCYPTGPSSDG